MRESPLPMQSKTRLERAEIALTSTMEEPRRAAPDTDSPFRILVLGDFSGRESRELLDPGDLGFDRRPVRVDRDNLDDVLEGMGVDVRLQLVEGGPFITLPLRRLEDFHPDRIFEQAAAFAYLFRTRLALQRPETFEEAARDVRAWGVPAEEPPDPAPAPQDEMPESGRLVAEMLDRQKENRADDAGTAGLEEFLRQVVRPHLAPAESPDREDLLASVDASVESWMRNVLHHPAFQDVEAAWRGIDFLARQIDSDSAIEVCLLDVSKKEVAQDLRGVRDLSGSRTWRLLVEEGIETPGAAWSLVVGLYRFAPTVEDVALLGRLAKIASAAGAPFLAEASSRILGCDSVAKTPLPREWRRDDPGGEQLWEALRTLPEASSVGLALPRFLLRLPYGAETDPLEEFRFEEMEDAFFHESLLWGNPALACASLLAQAFERGGWRFRPGAIRDIDGLPLYISKAASEARVTPCAEVVLSERAAEAILDKGLMPLFSLPDRDAIRVIRFQSIASPPRPLAGAWE